VDSYALGVMMWEVYCARRVAVWRGGWLGGCLAGWIAAAHGVPAEECAAGWVRTAACQKACVYQLLCLDCFFGGFVSVSR
jgi:hypothetical protein